MNYMTWDKIKEKMKESYPNFDESSNFIKFLEQNYNPPTEKSEPLVEIYKIRHKPTGLFYQNLKDRLNSVSKGGEVYYKFRFAKSPFNPEKKRGHTIYVSKNGTIHKLMSDMGYEFKEYGYGQLYVNTPANDWEIVKIQ